MARSPAQLASDRAYADRQRATRDESLFDRITRTISVEPDDGVPHVSDLPSDLISQFDTPYMERYFLLGNNKGSGSRFHHILKSDVADLHDHPWNFVSVIISGRYIETTPTTEHEYGPGSVLVRTAEQLHRLTLPDGPVWTFISVSKPRRKWGFQTSDGWVHWSRYLNPTPQPDIPDRWGSRQW